MKDKTSKKAKTPAGKVAPKRGAQSKALTAKKRASSAEVAKPAAQKAAGGKTAAKSATVKQARSMKKSAAGAKTSREAKKLAAKTKKQKAAAEENEAQYRIGGPVIDPIGDTTDGEGQTYLGELVNETEAPAPAVESNAEVDAFRRETHIEASDVTTKAGPGMAAVAGAMEASARSEAVDTAANAVDAGGGEHGGQREPAKLERLQKILSQAGIASRRRAEEMITEGRVMVNGQVVTTLGSKADLEHDHIRVDGKLLHGAERHRYFLLNKPRGFVTTVSDPEGRPTVMKFFENMHERLYPVGRLDYQSEGLLLMTNDGELANLLTKAGSGVEKTYLVKVAGRPTEEELEKLRGGVTIERGEAGSGRVRTAPARVRQVRVGDNPWFEVVLIEGRNRELRKMFGAVGHFVEKIKRVGYGPLALDVEPGNLRELRPEEVTTLRLTAEGKMKPKRLHADRMLPKDAGMAAEKREEKRGGRGSRDFGRRESAAFAKRGSGEFARREGGSPRRSESGSFEKRERRDFGTRDGRGSQRREGGGFGRREGAGFRGRESAGLGKRGSGGFAGRDNKPFQPSGERRAFKPGGFRERPKFEGRRPFGGEKRPFDGGRTSSGPKRVFDRPRFESASPGKPQFDKPKLEKRGFEKGSFERPRSGKLRIEKVESDKRSFERPRFDKPRVEKPGFNKRGFGDRPGGQGEGRQENRPRKPFRPQGDRPGGFKRPGKSSGTRPGGAGRPKTGFGGRPGGFGKSNRPGGFKRPNKQGGAGRGGPRFGGSRPGGR